jgi:hypothetical protein
VVQIDAKSCDRKEYVRLLLDHFLSLFRNICPSRGIGEFVGGEDRLLGRRSVETIDELCVVENKIVQKKIKGKI